MPERSLLTALHQQPDGGHNRDEQTPLKGNVDLAEHTVTYW